MPVKTYGQFRLSTRVTVRFPTAPSLKAQPRRIDFHQEIGGHDSLVLEYEKTSSDFFEILKTGTPVEVKTVQEDRASVWVGYVNYVSKENNGQMIQYMRIACLGSSFLLKARSQRTFKKVSVTDVAKKLAKELGFGFVGEPSTRKFDQLSMTGETYWQFLQTQAARIGYGMYVHNAVIYMRPLDKLIDANNGNSPILSIDTQGPMAGNRYLDRTLDSFEVLNGDHIEKDWNLNTKKATAGTDPMTAKRFSSLESPKGAKTPLKKNTGTPLFTDYSMEVVHSKAFSKAAAKEMTEFARLTIPAEAEGQGDVRMSPFNTVYLRGTGPSTDGFWVIRKVTHMFLISGAYQVELQLITDGMGAGSKSAFRSASTKGLGVVNLNDQLAQSSSSRAGRKRGPVLTKVSPIIVQTQQGLAQLGTVWSGK